LKEEVVVADLVPINGKKIKSLSLISHSVLLIRMVREVMVTNDNLVANSFFID